MGYVFVPTWCLLLKKKKKLLSRLLLSSFGFPNSGITVTESFQEMGPTVQSSFPVTGSRLVSFCHSWSPVLLLYFSPVMMSHSLFLQSKVELFDAWPNSRYRQCACPCTAVFSFGRKWKHRWHNLDAFRLFWFFFLIFFCWLTLAVSQEWLYRIVF